MLGRLWPYVLGQIFHLPSYPPKLQLFLHHVVCQSKMVFAVWHPQSFWIVAASCSHSRTWLYVVFWFHEICSCCLFPPLSSWWTPVAFTCPSPEPLIVPFALMCSQHAHVSFCFRYLTRTKRGTFIWIQTLHSAIGYVPSFYKKCRKQKPERQYVSTHSAKWVWVGSAWLGEEKHPYHVALQSHVAAKRWLMMAMSMWWRQGRQSEHPQFPLACRV